MAEAFRGNIICPNKEKEADASFHKGHLLETETYVGGRVESLEADWRVGGRGDRTGDRTWPLLDRGYRTVRYCC